LTKDENLTHKGAWFRSGDQFRNSGSPLYLWNG